MATNSHPDWNDLTPVLALARHGSLAAAARALGLQHSSVSRRIAAFEYQLGTRLFHRSPTGTTLTDDGARLLPLAIKAEVALMALLQAARDQPRVLRLSLPTGLAPLIAPAIVALQRAQAPIAIHVQASSHPADIAAGDADIALRLAPIKDPSLVMRKVAQVGLALYASPAYLKAHPLRQPPDFAGHQLIGLHPNLATTPAARWLEDNAKDATTVMQLAQMAEVRATAASGIGLALLPCFLGDATAELVRARADVLVYQTLMLACRRDVAIDPAARKVIGALVRAIKAQSAALAGDGEDMQKLT
jgi:DNA-binding transcriptional LysR family regulator